jgi:two-component system sensor histidine kinase VicK
LGLSIARNVIKAHGGTIELLAAAPHGTRVRITLPSVPVPRAAEISSAAKGRQNAISVI